MKKIVTASTNPEVIQAVAEACKSYSTFSSSVFASTEAVVSFINFELPEIKVIDYTSEDIDCARILEAIHSDSWLHYGGIIAVCGSRAQVKEIEEQKDENILSVMTVPDFTAHCGRLLKILHQNQQFLFTRGMQDILGGREEGHFTCDNDPMDIRFYTNFLISYLYNTNRISDEDRGTLQMTLMELLMNAVEHGNLNITYQEKTDWLLSGGDILELIEKRRSEEQYRDRTVRISYVIQNNTSAFRIEDDGDGFDWRAMLSQKDEDNDGTHGRGISLSRKFVKKISYNEKGNQVTVTIANRVNSVNTIPGIMNTFDILEYKDRDIVCRQDEMSNDLFFIVSGQFAVYVNRHLTTVLTPNDMFIGEMAFLLNDRRTATVMAVGPCKLIKVPKTAFLSLIRRNPHYGIFLSKMLAQRLVLQAQNSYIVQQKLDELQSIVKK